MNKIIFGGNVTADPVVKTYGDNKVLANFTIAENAGRKSTVFMKTVCFGKQAEFVEKYMKKGAYVCVSGRVETDEYTNNEEVKVKSVNIVAENIDLPKSKNVSRETKDGDGLLQGPLKELLKQMAENA